MTRIDGDDSGIGGYGRIAYPGVGIAYGEKRTIGLESDVARSAAGSLFFHLNFDNRFNFLIKKLPVSLFADCDGADNNFTGLRAGCRDRVTGCEAWTPCRARKKTEKMRKRVSDMTAFAASENWVRKDSAKGASLVFIASQSDDSSRG